MGGHYWRNVPLIGTEGEKENPVYTNVAAQKIPCRPPCELIVKRKQALLVCRCFVVAGQNKEVVNNLLFTQVSHIKYMKYKQV